MRFYVLSVSGFVLMLRPAFRLLSSCFLSHATAHLTASSRRLARPPGSQVTTVRTLIATGACILAVVGGLAACSPIYDWRTVMNNDNGYAVDLPAKPSNDSREVNIGGTPMQMSMQTAEAGKAVFAIGTVMLPTDAPKTQQTALDFLRDGLARNVGAAPDAHTVEIPLAAGGQVPGLEMTLSGKAGEEKETRTIYARLVVHGKHVYQAAIIASQPLPQDQVDQFFQSFRLY
jgi:hypothetical protein